VMEQLAGACVSIQSTRWRWWRTCDAGQSSTWDARRSWVHWMTLRRWLVMMTAHRTRHAPSRCTNVHFINRPHRSTTYVDAANCYRPSNVVWLLPLQGCWACYRCSFIE